MNPIPIAASRPDPQRSSAYGSMSTHAVVTRIAIGSSGPSVNRPAAVSSSEVPPNAITVTSSGCVRRQSSATDRPTQTTRPAGRQIRSTRKIVSRTAETAITASSSQSHQTRAGGSGARGSARKEWTALLTWSP